MLLYVLDVGYCQQDGDSHSDEVDGMIPMAALFHSRGNEESNVSLLAEYCHIATKEDEYSIQISY